MPSPARPRPTSRVSINPAGTGLAERNLNTQAQASETVKAKRRAVMSMGGKPESEELTPKSQARRTAKPRKSILKSFAIPQFHGNDENQDEEQEEGETLVHQRSIMVPAAETTLVDGHSTRQEAIAAARRSILSNQSMFTMEDGHAHTMTFGSRPSMNRRVSFAPSAHVRMFEAPAQPSIRRRSSMAVVPSGAIAGQPNTFALPPPAPVVAVSGRASSHGRRSSIQNLSAIGVNNENIGEGSMDMSIEDHTDSEEGGSEDGDQQVHMASNQSVYSNAETEAEEMSMEMTQNFGGGVIAHQGDESFRTESEANTSTRSDEEKTMEFTIAIGGFLPAAPPTGAQRGRASVGYSHIDPSGAFAQPIIPGEGDEMDMEMDETVAFGGIINTSNVNVDDTISSTGSEDQNNQRDRTMTFSFGDLRSAAREEQTDMDMDMTTVGGGIFSQPQQQQRQNIFATTTPAAQPKSPRAPVQNIFATSTSTSTVAPKSPRPQPNIFSTSTTPKSPRLPTLTHPTSSTPSFARPTASSASKSKTKSPEKEKRDIYGPSPSPAKSATPRKSGMQTASEVARRLSFGSSAGGSVHGSAKRSRVDESDQENQNEQEGSVKKQKIGLGDSIFGRPRQSLALGGVQQSPIRALPTLAGSGGTAASARSPARPRQSVAIPTITIQPEAEHHEEEEERGEDWEPPVIGLSTFLEMAGVQFVDRLPSMARRKSAGKSLGANYRDREFAPCDYTEAKIQSIFLHTYNWATSKVRSDIVQCQSELTYNEQIYDKMNPPVVTEYLAANDSDRMTFEKVFRSFKVSTELRARANWYDWKFGMMEKVRPDVEEVLDEMVQDEEKLDTLSSEVDTYLPQLRQRAAELQAELLKEREVVAELEACDQAELGDWKNTVKELKSALDDQTSEYNDTTSKLSDLQAKLRDYEKTVAEHQNAIMSARSKCDEWTKSDVGRLQQEYETLQHLHQWKINHLRADQFELTYSDQLRLSFGCQAFVPDVSSASLSLVHDIKSSGATEGLLDLVKSTSAQLLKSRSKLSLAQLIQRIGSLWNSAQRLSSELHLVNQQYPITYSSNGNGNGNGKSQTVFTCGVTMMIPSKRAKIILEFGITGEVLMNWPEGLGRVGVDVKGIYGDADLSLLKLAAEETVATVSEEGYIGALVSACRDVAQQHA